MRVCNKCGGLQATEQGESIAGQACLCRFDRLPIQLTEADVRRIIREELQACGLKHNPFQAGSH